MQYNLAVAEWHACHFQFPWSVQREALKTTVDDLFTLIETREHTITLLTWSVDNRVHNF